MKKRLSFFVLFLMLLSLLAPVRRSLASLPPAMVIGVGQTIVFESVTTPNYGTRIDGGWFWNISPGLKVRYDFYRHDGLKLGSLERDISPIDQHINMGNWFLSNPLNGVAWGAQVGNWVELTVLEGSFSLYDAGSGRIGPMIQINHGQTMTVSRLKEEWYSPGSRAWWPLSFSSSAIPDADVWLKLKVQGHFRGHVVQTRQGTVIAKRPFTFDNTMEPRTIEWAAVGFNWQAEDRLSIEWTNGEVSSLSSGARIVPNGTMGPITFEKWFEVVYEGYTTGTITSPVTNANLDGDFRVDFTFTNWRSGDDAAVVVEHIASGKYTFRDIAPHYHGVGTGYVMVKSPGQGAIKVQLMVNSNPAPMVAQYKVVHAVTANHVGEPAPPEQVHDPNNPWAGGTGPIGPMPPSGGGGPIDGGGDAPPDRTQYHGMFGYFGWLGDYIAWWIQRPFVALGGMFSSLFGNVAKLFSWSGPLVQVFNVFWQVLPDFMRVPLATFVVVGGLLKVFGRW